MLGYSAVSILHQTLTWATRSLTCTCDLFACAYTQGTSVYSLIWRTFVESAQNLTPQKISGCTQSLARNCHHPFGDHTPSCLTLAFEKNQTNGHFKAAFWPVKVFCVNDWLHTCVSVLSLLASGMITPWFLAPCHTQRCGFNNSDKNNDDDDGDDGTLLQHLPYSKAFLCLTMKNNIHTDDIPNSACTHSSHTHTHTHTHTQSQMEWVVWDELKEQVIITHKDKCETQFQMLSCQKSRETVWSCKLYRTFSCKA